MKEKCKRIKKSLGPQITQCWGMIKFKIEGQSRSNPFSFLFGLFCFSVIVLIDFPFLVSFHHLFLLVWSTRCLDFHSALSGSTSFPPPSGYFCVIHNHLSPWQPWENRKRIDVGVVMVVMAVVVVIVGGRMIMRDKLWLHVACLVPGLWSQLNLKLSSVGFCNLHFRLAFANPIPNM